VSPYGFPGLADLEVKYLALETGKDQRLKGFNQIVFSFPCFCRQLFVLVAIALAGQTTNNQLRYNRLSAATFSRLVSIH